MSLLNAMYTGVSGLDAESNALGVIGNNVSNTNTVGFKESRAVFENVMGAAAGQDAIGSGVVMAHTQQIFTEGALQNTGNPTDMALSGDGFFVVQGAVGGSTGDFYTRAGQGSLNSSGTLVNPDGLAFQGYAISSTGQMSSQLGPITLNTAALPPKTTQNVTVTANLNANAPVLTQPWDPQNPSATSNFSTSMNVYDSLGNSHQVQVYFVNNGGNAWTYHALANGSEVQGGTAGQNFDFADGTLNFNPDGSLQSVTPSGGAVSFTNANPQTINFNLGNPIASGGTGFGGTTQFGTPSAIASQSQDGYASGSLSGVQIGSDGTVSGTYTNGQSIAVGQLAIAKFQANTGLASAGQNVWAATKDSGAAALGTAGAGGRAAITTGSLEQSNVDIASQFVDLIAHQQGFQANSKTIQTASQMVTTLMQIVQ